METSKHWYNKLGDWLRKKSNERPTYFDDDLGSDANTEQDIPWMLYKGITMVIISAIIISAATYFMMFLFSRQDGIPGIIAELLATYCLNTGHCDLAETIPAFGIAQIILVSVLMAIIYLTRPYFQFSDEKREHGLLGERLEEIRYQLQILKDRLIIDPTLEKLKENETIDRDTGEIYVLEGDDEINQKIYRVKVTDEEGNEKHQKMSRAEIIKRYPELLPIAIQLERLIFESPVNGERVVIIKTHPLEKWQTFVTALLLVACVVGVGSAFFGKPYAVFGFTFLVVNIIAILLIVIFHRRK